MPLVYKFTRGEKIFNTKKCLVSTLIKKMQNQNQNQIKCFTLKVLMNYVRSNFEIKIKRNQHNIVIKLYILFKFIFIYQKLIHII